MSFDPNATSSALISSKWTIDLNIKPKIPKFLGKKNMAGKSRSSWVKERHFWYNTNSERKQLINVIDQKTLKEIKTQVTDGEKIRAKYIADIWTYTQIV